MGQRGGGDSGAERGRGQWGNSYTRTLRGKELGRDPRAKSTVGVRVCVCVCVSPYVRMCTSVSVNCVCLIKF